MLLTTAARRFDDGEIVEMWGEDWFTGLGFGEVDEIFHWVLVAYIVVQPGSSVCSYGEGEELKECTPGRPSSSFQSSENCHQFSQTLPLVA